MQAGVEGLLKAAATSPIKEDEIKSSGPMASDARELRTKELRKLEAGLDHRQRLNESAARGGRPRARGGFTTKTWCGTG